MVKPSGSHALYGKPVFAMSVGIRLSNARYLGSTARAMGVENAERSDTAIPLSSDGG
jgi:hypothetical protein